VAVQIRGHELIASHMKPLFPGVRNAQSYTETINQGKVFRARPDGGVCRTRMRGRGDHVDRFRSAWGWTAALAPRARRHCGGVARRPRRLLDRDGRIRPDGRRPGVPDRGWTGSPGGGGQHPQRDARRLSEDPPRWGQIPGAANGSQRARGFASARTGWVESTAERSRSPATQRRAAGPKPGCTCALRRTRATRRTDTEFHAVGR
jgi:hypothetical protein